MTFAMFNDSVRLRQKMRVNLKTATKVCNRTTCRHNGAEQSLTNFNKNKNGLNGYKSTCKSCAKDYRIAHSVELSAYTKRWNAEHPDHRKSYDLKRYYGISLEQFNDILTAQRGRCAGCDKPFTSNNKPFVHHSHKTGMVIGLWHHSCNIAEGHMKTPEVALAIARAMERESVVLNNYDRGKQLTTSGCFAVSCSSG